MYKLQHSKRFFHQCDNYTKLASMNLAPFTTTTITHMHSYVYCPYFNYTGESLVRPLSTGRKASSSSGCSIELSYCPLSNAATIFGPMGGCIRQVPLTLWIITVSICHIPIDALSDNKWENSSSTCSIINRFLQQLNCSTAPLW